MELVDDHLAVKAELRPPTDDGFLVPAAEVGAWRGPFPSVPEGLTARLKAMTADIDAVEANATVLKGIP